MEDAQSLGLRIADARKTSGLTQAEAAEKLGVAPARISEWERGVRRPNAGSISRLAALFGLSVDTLLHGRTHASGPQKRVPRGTPTAEPADWPGGWRARAYRLQLEAAEAGATEEEIEVVKGWMLDPALQAMWAGGQPSAEQAKNLEGIEVGARAWLRARGRNVRGGR